MPNLNNIVRKIAWNLQKAFDSNDQGAQIASIRHAAQVGKIVSRNGPRPGANKTFEMHHNPINGHYHLEVFDQREGGLLTSFGQIGRRSPVDQYGSCDFSKEGIATPLNGQVPLPSSLAGEGQELIVRDIDINALLDAVDALQTVLSGV